MVVSALNAAHSFLASAPVMCLCWSCRSVGTPLVFVTVALSSQEWYWFEAVLLRWSPCSPLYSSSSPLSS